jgi:hypothetical protein
VLSEEEREQRAIERMNEGTVYFNGQKFNIKSRKEWTELQTLKENAYNEALNLGLIQKKKQYRTNRSETRRRQEKRIHYLFSSR